MEVVKPHKAYVFMVMLCYVVVQMAVMAKKWKQRSSNEEGRTPSQVISFLVQVFAPLCDVSVQV